MTDSQRIEQLERQLRTLRRYLLGSIGLMAVVAAAAFAPPPEGARFTEIAVERINVIEADGRYALVIANAARLPGPIIRNEEYPPEISGGRTRASGMLFFNHEGTEAGGLTYGSEATQAGSSAGGSFTFDRMNQDQVVQITYQEGRGVFAGLNVWDRPERHIEGVLAAVMARREGAIDEDELQRRVQPEVAGTAHRLRLGSLNRDALLEIADTNGRTRIRLAVDSLDAPSLQFLDAAGHVVLRLPDAP